MPPHWTAVGNGLGSCSSGRARRGLGLAAQAKPAMVSRSLCGERQGARRRAQVGPPLAEGDRGQYVETRAQYVETRAQYVETRALRVSMRFTLGHMCLSAFYVVTHVSQCILRSDTCVST